MAPQSLPYGQIKTMSVWKKIDLNNIDKAKAPWDGEDVLGFWHYFYPGDKGPTIGYDVVSWDMEARRWLYGEKDSYHENLITCWTELEPPDFDTLEKNF